MLELGAARASVGSYFRQAPLRTLVELGYRHQPGSGWALPVSLGGGVRLGLPVAGAQLPVEAFGRAGLNASWGPWEPALTLELGLSGLTDVVPRQGYPSDPTIPGEEGLPSTYLAFEAEPLRARFGRFTVSALSLQWGTSLIPAGQTLRLQLGFLKVGVNL